MLVSNPVPLTVTIVPAAATDVDSDVIVGAPTAELLTEKLCELVTGPSVVVCTVTVPDVAPDGTFTASAFAVAAATVATVP